MNLLIIFYEKENEIIEILKGSAAGYITLFSAAFSQESFGQKNHFEKKRIQEFLRLYQFMVRH
jgi:hypothetical protein